MGRNPLTQERLKECLSYDPETGHFTNLKSGKITGWLQTGYLKTVVDGRKYYLHRLAWLYMFGSFPDKEIDHKDGDRANNALSNLRPATREQNHWNKKVRCDNRTGLKGVEYIPRLNKYRAVISFQGIKHRLGTFSTALEASDAYNREASYLHKEFYYERKNLALR